MSIIGTVASVWRYPVKSMRGEECAEIFAGFSGVYGDRIFAFRSSANRVGFPFFGTSDEPTMLLFRPRFRFPENAIAPINLTAAERIAPGASPLPASASDLMVDVTTPDGRELAIDDPALLELLRARVGPDHQLSLLRSDRSFTDCRPLSLMSRQTVTQLEAETGLPCDQRRFRANLYLDLESGRGFDEDQYVGRSLRCGEKAVVAILERDPRCSMITLDPETADKSSALLKTIAQKHDANAGVYAAVLVEGIIRRGDAVEVLA